MSDPTSAISLGTNAFQVATTTSDLVIKNAEALVKNALASVDLATGKVEFADDAAGLVPVGLVECASDGNADHLTGSTSAGYKAITRGGIKVQWAVTGATAKTDIGKLVYATDGQTLTLTRPSAGVPFGLVTDWISSTTCEIYVFSMVEALQASVTFSKQIKPLATLNSLMLEGTDANVFYKEVAVEHYKILSLHAIPTSYDAGLVAGSRPLNMDINGTNTTGGVLTLAYTSFDALGDMGTVIDATAITAANEVHQGDSVSLEMAASGTGFTASQDGAVHIYAVIERLPGA